MNFKAFTCLPLVRGKLIGALAKVATINFIFIFKFQYICEKMKNHKFLYHMTFIIHSIRYSFIYSFRNIHESIILYEKLVWI